jgi:hypothetical protein
MAKLGPGSQRTGGIAATLGVDDAGAFLLTAHQPKDSSGPIRARLIKKGMI